MFWSATRPSMPPRLPSLEDNKSRRSSLKLVKLNFPLFDKRLWLFNTLGIIRPQQCARNDNESTDRVGWRQAFIYKHKQRLALSRLTWSFLGEVNYQIHINGYICITRSTLLNSIKGRLGHWIRRIAAGKGGGGQLVLQWAKAYLRTRLSGTVLTAD